jgi:site-specific recombinase XerD
MRALRRYLATRKDSLPWLFVSERSGQLTRQQVGNLVRNAGRRIGLKVWPHMLRHACGFKLCNENVNTRIVQEYLGHRNIMHTVRYTKVSGKAFDGLWR